MTILTGKAKALDQIKQYEGNIKFLESIKAIDDIEYSTYTMQDIRKIAKVLSGTYELKESKRRNNKPIYSMRTDDGSLYIYTTKKYGKNEIVFQYKKDNFEGEHSIHAESKTIAESIDYLYNNVKDITNNIPFIEELEIKYNEWKAYTKDLSRDVKRYFDI